MDYLEQCLMGVGHRRRPFVRVLTAIVDLLVYQDSEYERVRVQARALLSLVLRETAEIRDLATEAARARGKAGRPEDDAALLKAAQALGIPRAKLEGAFDQIDYATAHRWIRRLQAGRKERAARARRAKKKLPAA